MGVEIHTNEVETAIAPKRLFKALSVGSDQLFPKVLPGYVTNIHTLQGDGGAGTIKKTYYKEGDKEKYFTVEIMEIDEEKLAYKNKMFEGDMLGEKLASVIYEVSFVGKGDGDGCICKAKSVYHIKDGFVITEEEINTDKEKWIQMVQLVQNYLLQNPSTYAA
ncbi:unnamed protein product [Cuscuta campestris]|uniref:Bet v I/Major latex protein domain-containing protein n=1 Tax=Cuscuta campestris TaxID=132261 RepID=A0A484KBZ6_9ASTE|nr:unnamed protein product [Cuscuta campestris]